MQIVKHSAIEMDEAEVLDMAKEKFANSMSRTGIHFGQPYFNTATVAGVYRMILKGIAQELGVDFPIK